MKRIVILIDGTWDKEGTTGNTNVAKLGVNALIKRRAANGTVQQVRYHVFSLVGMPRFSRRYSAAALRRR